MADPFQPKFVDLVRNYSTTTGTGNFTLGPAVNGHSSFTSALQVGDSFYYSAIGIDKPAEREVGRGTLLSGGVISRDPVSGAKTNFSSGTKAIALVAAAEWFTGIHALASAANNPSAAIAPTQAALAAAPTDRPALLTLKGREGIFTFDPADLAAQVAADDAQTLYVASKSDPSGASGAWVRRYSGATDARWNAASGNGVDPDTVALAETFALTSHSRIPSGTYPLSSVTIPATRSVETAGLSTKIKQLAGVAAGTRILHVSGNSRFGDLSFEGLLGAEAVDGQKHGYFLLGSATNGGISQVSFGNVVGTNINGDIAYLGGGSGTIGTATISIASPAVVTRVGHGLSNGDEVMFGTTGALPTGLSANTNYYVINATADTFQLAAYKGGAAINTSGTQSGTHTLYAHRYPVSQISFGNITGNNVYRHGFTITGGVNGVEIDSIVCGSAGIRVIDIENDIYRGDAKGVRVGYAQGRTAAVVASGVRATGIDFGMLDLHPYNYGTGSTPAWSGGGSTDNADTALYVRNADVRIGKLLASHYNARAIEALSTNSITSVVSIANAEVANCDRLNSLYGYFNGLGRTGYGCIFRIDALRAQADTASHRVIANAGGAHVGYAEVALASTARLVSDCDDASLDKINVTALTGNGGTVVQSATRAWVGGGKATCDRFFSSCTRSVAWNVDITTVTGIDVSGTNNSFWASVLNGTFYFLYANGGTIQITDAGVFRAVSYNVGSTEVINSAARLTAAAFPALTGDVTTAGGALATTIASNAVTYAKMQDVSAASRLIGRGSSSAGDPEEVSLGVSFVMNGTTLERAPLTGDVTAPQNSNATTIAANAVTYAKLQQVAAASLVGNPTGALANAQGITLAGGLTFSGTTLTLGAVTPTSLAASGTITSSGGKIGYAAGAGGAVTQATSKSTGVTLNKPSGAITMNAASLAANTAVSFTFTNSEIGANDEVSLWIKSGTATGGAYLAQVDQVNAGSCRISLRNLTSGALAEAVVLGFAVRSAAVA